MPPFYCSLLVLAFHFPPVTFERGRAFTPPLTGCYILASYAINIMAKTQNTELTLGEKIQATGQGENLLTVAGAIQGACSDYGRIKGKIKVIGTKGATLNKKLKVMNQTVTYDTSDLSKLETARLDSCLKVAKAYKLLCGVWILDDMAESL